MAENGLSSSWNYPGRPQRVSQIHCGLCHYGNSDIGLAAFQSSEQVDDLIYDGANIKFNFRAGFQMLLNALDPTFTLSSDFYYRSLLAKVFLNTYLKYLFIPIVSDLCEGEGNHSQVYQWWQSTVCQSCSWWLEYSSSWIYGVHSKYVQNIWKYLI